MCNPYSTKLAFLLHNSSWGDHHGHARPPPPPPAPAPRGTFVIFIGLTLNQTDRRHPITRPGFLVMRPSGPADGDPRGVSPLVGGLPAQHAACRH